MCLGQGRQPIRAKILMSTEMPHHFGHLLQVSKKSLQPLTTGVSLELSDREKFCDIFRSLGRSFDPNFGFPYMFYTFSLLPQLKIGRSQPA